MRMHVFYLNVSFILSLLLTEFQIFCILNNTTKDSSISDHRKWKLNTDTAPSV